MLPLSASGFIRTGSSALPTTSGGSWSGGGVVAAPEPQFATPLALQAHAIEPINIETDRVRAGTQPIIGYTAITREFTDVESTDQRVVAPEAGTTGTTGNVRIGSQLSLPKGGPAGAFQAPSALPGVTSGPAPVAQNGAATGTGVTCAAATGITNAVPCDKDPNSCCCPPGMAPNTAGNLCIAPAGAGAGAGAGGLGGSLPLIAGAAALALLFMRR